MSDVVKQFCRGVKLDRDFYRIAAQKIDPQIDRDAEKTLCFNIFRIKANQLVSCRNEPIFNELKVLTGFEEAVTLIGSEFVSHLRDEMQFKAFTDMQRVAIPFALQHRNFAVIAQTGTGKTLGYLLPLIAKLLTYRARGDFSKALVLAPTKELVHQIYRVATGLLQSNSSLVACSLQRSKIARITLADILISTPGIAFAMDTLQLLPVLATVSLCVLDEMDLLLSQSFRQQTYAIIDSLDKENLGLMLYSASLPGCILETVDMIVKQGPILRVGQDRIVPSNIEQQLIAVQTELQKIAALRQIIYDREFVPPCIIFVQDVERTQLLVEVLSVMNVSAAALNSDLKTEHRQKVLDNFRAGQIFCLVTTDLAARGLDCVAVRLVINFDLPTSREAYLHRIGRSGRSEYKGKAITFYTERDLEYLRIIVGVLKDCNIEIPTELQKLHRVDVQKLSKKKIQRKPFCYLSKEQHRKALIKASLRKQHRSSK